uniref:Uncharacterized protein n=1 Tax=Micrurus carvalhoi TaxID=3147026 RepID=A0A2H6N3G1_9SAUR
MENDVEGDTSDDPMVSKPIQPFILPVTLWKKRTEQGIKVGALIDSGCTRCLVTKAVVDKIGLNLIKLKVPIKFEQVDGSILGGIPATHRTEYIKMVMGEH